MNNYFSFVGRLTRDLELRYTNNNKPVVKMSVAINNSKEDTSFVDVTLFGKTAETTAEYCRKGDLIGVSGVVKNHNWEDKNGLKHYDYSFLGNKITFLQTKNENKEKSNTEIVQEVMNNDIYGKFGEEISIGDDFLD